MHWLGAFGQEVCVVKTLIRLMREIKYSKPQREGEKGKQNEGWNIEKQ